MSRNPRSAWIEGRLGTIDGGGLHLSAARVLGIANPANVSISATQTIEERVRSWGKAATREQRNPKCLSYRSLRVFCRHSLTYAVIFALHSSSTGSRHLHRDPYITQDQVANSNIIALVATLLVRLVAGPCCDRFGPRLTFAGCLLLGSIPTFLCGAVFNVSGLYAIRFFIGILGGSFVPCQVWTTGP